MAKPQKDDKRDSLIEAKAKVQDLPFDEVLKLCFEELRPWQNGGTDGYRTEIWEFLKAAAKRARMSAVP